MSVAAQEPATDSLLRVTDLTVRSARVERPLLDGVSFTLDRGRTLGVVGPSGAGKSTLALAIARLLPRGLSVDGASTIHLGGDALHELDANAMRAIRGRRIGYVFQEPALALDPAMSIGRQVAESAQVHGVPEGEAATRALEWLERVGFPDARRAARSFPHELSGGMRQRALIASAMILEPELLIADEPTTALDPTIQDQVLDLLARLRQESRTTLLFISHDLATVAERCERVIAIERGRIVDDRSATEAVAAYRARRAIPSFEIPTPEPGTPLLRVRDLEVEYTMRGLFPWGAAATRTHTAVAQLDLQIARGEVVALVGESGCGKTSSANAILRLVEPRGGSVLLDGLEMGRLKREPLRRLRRRIQLVPQDAGASLTPHLTAEACVAEGLEVHGLAEGATARRKARELLAELGLPERVARAVPRELSSGERQRVAIARALAPDPDLLICDEPLASIDETSRAQVLTVLSTRRARRGLALLLISHDLDAVRRLASRVLVMYLGRVIEHSVGDAALVAPRMPYTQALVAAIPTGDPSARLRRSLLRGELPILSPPSAGCSFQPRCTHPLKDERCSAERPMLLPVGPAQPTHHVACWHALQAP